MSTMEKILLVDDMPANLHTLSRSLSEEYDLYIATSGESALMLAKSILPDLILLDMMMPEMDGLEVMEHLKASDWGANIPVMLITADDRAEIQVVCLDKGASDFVAKPLVVPVVRARIRNLLERQRLQRELIRLATFDELTGLYNRRSFFERASDELKRVKRYDSPCCLLMLDIDHFKNINDTFGHANGDKILQSFSKHISGLLRETDIFSRLGGEEFVVMLPQTSLNGGEGIAERIRQTIEKMQVYNDENVLIPTTVSIGLTVIRETDANVDEALLRSDEALYVAKDSGRNCVRSSELTMGQA